MRTASDQLVRSAEYRDAGYWNDDTFPGVVDRWADDDPRRPYLSDGTSTLSYGQFRDQAWTLAASLAGQGIGRGDRVAVQLPNWNEFFLVYAACARLGAVVIPIAPVYRAGEVGFIVANSGADAVITCGEFRGFDHTAMAAEIVAACVHPVTQIVVRADPPPGALTLDSLLSGASGVLPGPPSADDPHLILYSSGTESRPKGCLHTWNTSSFLPKQAIPAMGLTRNDVMFMPAPVTHALGLTLGLMAPTLAGASVELLDIFRPAAALERVTQRGCTGTASPAPFIRMMLDAYDPAAHDVSRLRFWLTAGAPIPAVLVEEAAARFSGCRIVPAYGSSEVMMATVCTPDDPIERVASSDGRPVPGVELRIVADGADAPAGMEGEIRYRGPAGSSSTGAARTLPPRPSTSRAGGGPGTPGAWTRPATCASPAGSRTSSSAAASTSARAKWKRLCSAFLPSRPPRSSGCPTRWSASGSARSSSWPRARTRRPGRPA